MRPAQDAAVPGRSARKREAILDAARTVFLRKGYGGASMDEVAALAAVSKQTVYKHFADKRRLFTAIVTGDIETAETLTQDMVAALPETEDVEKDLRAFARRHVAEVTQPHLVRLRRLVIAEAERFPELAQTWYASGPERAHATLAEQFRKLGRRGVLHVHDPLLAAQHFNWLILSIPLNAAMLNGEETTFSRRQLNRFADEGVRVFLAAYGTGERERRLSPVTDLPQVSKPAERALTAAGYTRLEQLAEVREEDIAGLHGVGPTVLTRLRTALRDHGMQFRSRP